MELIQATLIDTQPTTLNKNCSRAVVIEKEGDKLHIKDFDKFDPECFGLKVRTQSPGLRLYLKDGSSIGVEVVDVRSDGVLSTRPITVA